MIEAIENILTHQVNRALSELTDSPIDPSQIQFQKTRKDFEGDITLVVFPLVRFIKKSPEQCGEMLGEILKNDLEEVVGFNVVKGFLNLVISDEYWIAFLNQILHKDNFGFSTPNSKNTVMVEYSSPNTNKPLHLGHLRNIFLGYSVAEILKANGHQVVKTQIVNDRGIHICKSMLAWKLFGNGESPESSGIKGDHLIGKYYVKFNDEYKKEIADLINSGKTEEEAKEEAPLMKSAREMLIKWEQNDAEVRELWTKMNSWVYKGFDLTYKEIGVEFDKVYYESETYLLGLNAVNEGLEKGVFFKKDDGSVWVDLKDEGLDEKILQRSDGTAVYMTQDIGTAVERFKQYPDLEYQIYTVGNEQEYHFKVLFAILEKLGFEKAKNNYHLSYGMVELPTGKMKSREGTVVDADDLLYEMKDTAQMKADELGKLDGIGEEEKVILYKQIGYGALKYFLLKVDPRKNMLFDPESSVEFSGNTGPSIQYGYVRSKAILRNSGQLEPQSCLSTLEISDHEKQMIKMIYDFPMILRESAENYSPALIANYAYDLVKDFNSFYQSTNILKEENEDLKSFRIALSAKLADVLKSAMGLLGIEMPERM